MFKRLGMIQSPEVESTTSAGTTNEAASAAEVETPASAEAEQTSQEAVTPVDWAEIADEGGDEGDGVAAPAPKPAEAAPVQSAIVAPKPAEIPASVAPVAAPATTVPTTPVSSVPSKTAEQIEADRVAAETSARASREQAFNGLVDYYKLPEDMQLKLSTEPENVLPLLAAKIHQSIADNLARTISEMLPRAIKTTQESLTGEEKAKSAFFSKWPALVGKEDAVLQVGAMFRRLNPTATPEEAIERIGKAVCETLGIASTSAAPAATTVKAPAAVVFTPAGGGGSGRGAAAPADNLFANLAAEFEAEDQRP